MNKIKYQQRTGVKYFLFHAKFNFDKDLKQFYEGVPITWPDENFKENDIYLFHGKVSWSSVELLVIGQVLITNMAKSLFLLFHI